MGKPVSLEQGHSYLFQSPPEALIPISPYLPKDKVIWECACGKGNLSRRLEELDYTVIASDILTGSDYLTWQPPMDWDIAVTNPPYTIKDKFLTRAYLLGKPFAFLLPITALEGKKRQALYRNYGLELVLFDKRINFEVPSGKGSTSWFATAWFTWGLNIGRDMTFVHME